MGKPPVDLGGNVPIALDDTQESLMIVRAVLSHLSDPAHTHVTLVHYLATAFWEYGGDSLKTAHYLDQQTHQRERREERLAVQ